MFVLVLNVLLVMSNWKTKNYFCNNSDTVYMRLKEMFRKWNVWLYFINLKKLWKKSSAVLSADKSNVYLY